MTDTTVTPPEPKTAPKQQTQNDDQSPKKPEAPKVEPKVVTWLEGLSGKKVQSQKSSDQVTEHRKLLDSDEFNESLEEIKNSMSFEIDRIPENFKQQLQARMGKLDKMVSMHPDRDPMQEIDSWHDMKKIKGIKPEVFENVRDALEKLLKQSKKLEESPLYHQYDKNGNLVEEDSSGNIIPKSKEGKILGDDGTPVDDQEAAKGKPVVNYAKIGADFWQPLVREGIIPENMVPGRFSEVEQTFKGASEAYNARLQEYADSLNRPQEIMAKLNPYLDVTEDLLKMAATTASLAANIKASESGQSSTQGSGKTREIMLEKKNIELALLCVTSARGVVNKATEKDVLGVVDAFNGALKGVLTATVGTDVAKYVSDSITATTYSSKALQKLAEGDVKGCFNDLADAVEKAVGQEDLVLGKALGAGFKLVAAGAGAANKDDPREIMAGAMKAVGKAVEATMKDYRTGLRDANLDTLKTEFDPDNLDPNSDKKKEYDEQVDYVKKFYSTDGKGVSDLTGGIPDAITLELKKMVDENIKALKLDEEMKKYNEAQEEALKNFRGEPDPEFETLLLSGFSELPEEVDEEGNPKEQDDEQEAIRLERQADRIETLIAICKKDQMTFDLAKKITTGGADFVANFLPGANVVSAGLKLMFAILEAIKHAEQLAAWTENLSDAKKSGSVQADAIMNRFDLQKKQTIKADIIVGLKAVDLVGAVVKTAGGPAAPAGLAISASAQLTEQSLQLADKIVTIVQMRNAWSLYKKALKEPRDRKNVRLALRKNPTLAKYAIAYGAVMDKNAIARKAVERCGINERALANANENVGKVVEYLETLYREDPTEKSGGIVFDERAWHPGPAELTFKSWGGFFKEATTSSRIKPLVRKDDVTKIGTKMANFEAEHKKFKAFFEDDWKAKSDDDVTGIDKLKTAADDLQSALDQYNPMDENGEAHKQMAEYVDGLADMASEISRDVIRIQYDVRTVKEEARLEQERVDARKKLEQTTN